MARTSIRAVILAMLATLTACSPTQIEKPRTSPQNHPVEEKPTTAVMDVIGSDMVASLIDPVKLSTLKDRCTNPRIDKITTILYTAKKPEKTLRRSLLKSSRNRLEWDRKRENQHSSNPEEP